MIPHIAIIMATYNGENYIHDQIESILSQSYSLFDLYIRDDASTDHTVEIIKSFSDSRIHLIEGKENLGYPASFYEIMKMNIIADYYSFADQDDVWYTDKLKRAITMLRKNKETDLPLTYYGGYWICDGELNRLRKSEIVRKNVQFKDTLFEVPGLEFTMVINREAYDLWLNTLPVKASARGTWAAILFSAAGKILIDNQPVADYRRHSEAVTSESIGTIKQWIWRIKVFISGKRFSSYRLFLKDFEEVAGKQLNDSQKRILSIFTNNSRLRKVAFPHRLRRKLTDEIMLRVTFIIGWL